MSDFVRTGDWFIGFWDNQLHVDGGEEFFDIDLHPDQAESLALQLLHDNVSMARALRLRVDRDGVEWLNRWFNAVGVNVNVVE